MFSNVYRLKYKICYIRLLKISIFINVLPVRLRNKCLLYYCLLYARLILIQNDFDLLIIWWDEWFMDLNFGKCKII
ncbi:hypothetical protein BpHYR1_044349 [Brachionus plicatilis]|uniref:Uncharacterized protein n=1 Tax=Brachionus plicatilis TaxID=10195 RepID=A0A3M7QPP2_BRAPC|nr:hypothetical protein BpHYR1_044349 [Brachionus plicatilis]